MAIGRPTLVLAFIVFVLTFCTALWWDRILGLLAPALPLTDGGHMVMRPMTSRLDTKMSDIKNPPAPRQASTTPDARMASGDYARVATFESDRGTHVYCRLSYAGTAADTWVIEYTATKWAERQSSAKQWRRSGCEAAMAAKSEMMPILQAMEQATATIPDTPQYKTEKTNRQFLSSYVRQMDAAG